MRTSLRTVAALILLAPSARAEDADLRQLVDDLTARVRELESAQRSESGGPEWGHNVRIGGNADMNYLSGEKNSIAPNNAFVLDNARLYFDFDLGWEADFMGRPLMQGSSFYVEWDIVRYGRMMNGLGAIYARLDGLGGSPWFNVKLGRMPIPYGEEYVRWYEERPNNPLLDFSAPSPYNWDEGVLLFGSDAEGGTGYVVSLMDGDDGFSTNTHSDLQIAGRLFTHPVEWAKLSVSGLHTGKLGRSGSDARSAMKFGWSQAVPFGSGTSVQSYQDGDPIAPNPSSVIDSLDAWEADLILLSRRFGQLWMAFGQAFIDSGGNSGYDRDLYYWITELIFELGSLNPMLDPFYLAARYSSIGTLDSDKGYRLIALNQGWDLGFNTKQASVVSTGVGMRLTRELTLKAQYTWVDFDVVRGVTESIRKQARSRSWFGIGLSVGF